VNYMAIFYTKCHLDSRVIRNNYTTIRKNYDSGPSASRGRWSRCRRSSKSPHQRVRCPRIRINSSQVLGQVLREGELEGLSHLGCCRGRGSREPGPGCWRPRRSRLAVHVCAAHRTSSAFGGFSSARPSLSPDRFSAACRSGFLARASSRAALFSAFASSLWRRSKL
jgi:hypothetical protein